MNEFLVAKIVQDNSDTVMVELTEALFADADLAEAINSLSDSQLDKLIAAVSEHSGKLARACMESLHAHMEKQDANND